MRIAVASQNFRTVTSHAGRTRRFLIFEAVPDTAPVEIGRLDLPPDLVFHDWQGDGPHPLDSVQVVIAASCGEGFIRRMARRGIVAVVTGETDPLTAATSYLAQPQPADMPDPDAGPTVGGCTCGDDHPPGTDHSGDHHH